MKEIYSDGEEVVSEAPKSKKEKKRKKKEQERSVMDECASLCKKDKKKLFALFEEFVEIKKKKLYDVDNSSYAGGKKSKKGRKLSHDLEDIDENTVLDGDDVELRSVGKKSMTSRATTKSTASSVATREETAHAIHTAFMAAQLDVSDLISTVSSKKSSHHNHRKLVKEEKKDDFENQNNQEEDTDNTALMATNVQVMKPPGKRVGRVKGESGTVVTERGIETNPDLYKPQGYYPSSGDKNSADSKDSKKGSKAEPYSEAHVYKPAKAASKPKRDYKHDPAGHDLTEAQKAMDNSPENVKRKQDDAKNSKGGVHGRRALQGMSALRYDAEQQAVFEEKYGERFDEPSRKYTTRQILKDWATQVEAIAEMIMLQGIRYPQQRIRLMMVRAKILARLWQWRDEADIEEEYTQEDHATEMNHLATVQRKLDQLDKGVRNMSHAGEMSSSDTEGDEVGELRKLKNARTNLRYALGEGTVPAA